MISQPLPHKSVGITAYRKRGRNLASLGDTFTPYNVDEDLCELGRVSRLLVIVCYIYIAAFTLVRVSETKLVCHTPWKASSAFLVISA